MITRRKLATISSFCALVAAGGAQAVTVTGEMRPLADPMIITTPPVAAFGGLNESNANGGGGVFGVFDIVVNFVTSVTASQEQAFLDAEQFWESQVFGYRTANLASSVQSVGGGQLTIDASIVPIDGDFGILGQAGATAAVNDGVDGSGFLVSTEGIMEFDVADVLRLEQSNLFDEVVKHEMAHVMGFSDFFWDFAGATDDSGTDTTYTGAHGLAAYQQEFDPLATFVPVEENGGPGTAYAHWDEALFADFANNPGSFGVFTNCLGETGFTCGNPELMTGVFDNQPTYVSDTTLGSFEDIGYATAFSNPPSVVPLPASAWMLLAALGGLLGLRHRSHRRAAA
jgi:hypothetical protein